MKKLVSLVVMAVVLMVLSMAGRAVRSGHADQPSPSVVMLAGSYAAKSVGFETFCTNAGGCGATSPTLVPFNTAGVGRGVVAANGNYCGTAQGVGVEVAGSAAPTNPSSRVVSGKITNFSLLSEEADSSFSIYLGGACNGSMFVAKGSTLLATGTTHDVFSNTGNRVDVIVTSYKKLSGDAAGVLDTVVLTRQP